MTASIRLEEKQIELDGRSWTLRVNMAVLDRLQENNGGDIGALLQKSVNEGLAEILAAMLNDWAEDQGWPEDWTTRKVKKNFSLRMLNELDILGMFRRAMAPAGAEKEPSPGEKPGN